MPLPPFTTPVPQPVFMPGISYQTEAPAPMSTAAPSPLPARITPQDESLPKETGNEKHHDHDHDNEDFKLPRLRLEIRDLSHRGAAVFLGAINASTCLESCIRNVLKWLYVSPQEPHTHPPPTRSVTLVLREMNGVAYTTNSDLDDEHKEIHFNLNYIANINPERHKNEITGVITHELVHCLQWTGKLSCPAGLIEGVADWVRLNCELAPPHWERETSGKWDGGYQHTAYFLEYLEQRFSKGTVRRINEKLRVSKYDEKPFWTEVVGSPVEQLWQDYRKKMKEGDSEPPADKSPERDEHQHADQVVDEVREK